MALTAPLLRTRGDVYPYPFIDPGEIGYIRALGNALGVLLGFIAVALLLVAVGRLKSTASRGEGESA